MSDLNMTEMKRNETGGNESKTNEAKPEAERLDELRYLRAHLKKQYRIFHWKLPRVNAVQMIFLLEQFQQAVSLINRNIPIIDITEKISSRFDNLYNIIITKTGWCSQLRGSHYIVLGDYILYML